MAALAALTSACGASSTDDTTGGASDGGDRPLLLATTSLWADVTSRVACGREVSSLVPPGADPHAFEPSLRDRQRIESAAAIIANGAGLEESLADLLAGTTAVAVADHVDVLSDGDGHPDPHVWHDPARVAGALDAIADAVVVAGLPADQVAGCVDDYRAQLLALDAVIADRLRAIPPERRQLVTNHASFAYFADRYGFEVIGTVIPSISTLGDSSAGQLSRLAALIDEHQVPAIFVERDTSTSDAVALADRLNIEVVALASDSLDTAGGTGAASYLDLLDLNAVAIATALG